MCTQNDDTKEAYTANKAKIKRRNLKKKAKKKQTLVHIKPD